MTHPRIPTGTATHIEPEVVTLPPIQAPRHTPGPWDWHGPYMTGAYKVTALHDGGGVSMHVYVNGADDPAINAANARLIAAAPELLHELRMLNVDANGEQRRNTPAWRAIARATGE